MRFWLLLAGVLSVVSPALGLQICSGDLSARKLTAGLKLALRSVCLRDVDDQREVVLVSPAADGKVAKRILPAKVEKAELAGERRRYYAELPPELTENKTNWVRYEILLDPKETIRNEGAMAEHYIGHVSRLERPNEKAPYQTVLQLNDIHFYAEIPDHRLHWGYEGKIGPVNWGKLAPDYETCLEGKEQSPVALVTADAKPTREAIQFDYRASKASFVNNGHTLLVNVASGNKITVKNRSYQLLQFHVHSPSEHLVDKKPYDLEVHFVHQAADKSLAVVGVLVKAMPGAPHQPTLTQILKEFPTKLNQPVEFSGDIHPERFLPPAGKRSYLGYPGSLTTPPCSEGVAWHVLTESITVTPEQAKEVLQVMGGENARRLGEGAEAELLPLNGRTLLRGPN